jgi:hypothetical protein
VALSNVIIRSMYKYEMSTRYLPGGKKRPARRADDLAAISELIV